MSRVGKVEPARALDCLRSVPLFADLSDDRLAWIAEHGEEVRLGTGDVVAHQGDPRTASTWSSRARRSGPAGRREEIFVVTLGEGSM
jgi:CRP-like cAMP-binding protein